MSQVSPDGRYVVTSIGPPNNSNQASERGARLRLRAFSTGCTAPITAASSSARSSIPRAEYSPGTTAKKARCTRCPGPTIRSMSTPALSGRPTGNTSSSAARWHAIRILPACPSREYANDPNETQIQYDLYKIPFNEGRGGKAVPVEGASGNGMSNNFPKVSPDGKWIVWVQNKNGLLMRPDSRLYIVPFAAAKRA